MALLKVCKIGSLMARIGPFSPRLMATFPTMPLQESSEKKTKATLENIRDTSAEVKNTAQDMRTKINKAADEIIVKAVKAATRALDSKENEKIKDSIIEEANNAKNFVSDEINLAEEKYEESKEIIGDKVNDAKNFASQKYEKVKDSN